MSAAKRSRRLRASMIPTALRLFHTAERDPGGVAHA
jgi:hypothetical protein